MFLLALLILLGTALLVIGYGQRGRRRRNRGYIIGGWIVIGLVVIPITVRIVGALSNNINWLAYETGSSLLDEIEDHDWTFPYEEYKEIIRRLQANDLDEQEIEHFTKIAYNKFTDKDLSSYEVKAINELRRQGKLTSEQKEVFFNRLIDLNLQAKTPALANQGIPVQIDIIPQTTWHGPEIWYGVDISVTPPLIENTIPKIRYGESYGKRYTYLLPASSGHLILRGPTSLIWHGIIQVENNKEQKVTCTIRINYFDKRPTDISKSNPVYTISKELEATSKITTDKSLTESELITDRQIRPAVLGMGSGDRLGKVEGEWQVACYDFNAYHYKGKSLLSMTVHNYNTPIGCAFDVTVHVDEFSYKARTICQQKGQSMSWVLKTPYPDSEPEWVKLTLTPNQELASESVGLSEIWGKPIEFNSIYKYGP